MIENLPLFDLYYNEEKGTKTLYHFTSSKSFFLILDDLKLKISSFKNLNDLNEANLRNFEFQNKEFRDELKEYIDNNCGIISFSQDYQIKGFPIKGINHPAMWAHYAGNSEGVCIAIDKDLFIKKNKNILSRKKSFYRFGSVRYRPINAPRNVVYNGEKLSEFIKKYYKSLFFLKHIDWQNEYEYRLFIIGNNEKLSIDGCIKYVVLGSKFYDNKKSMNELIDKITNAKSMCFRKFVPHSFAVAVYGIGGYRADGVLAVHGICDIIENKVSDYKDYKDYLDEMQK